MIIITNIIIIIIIITLIIFITIAACFCSCYCFWCYILAENKKIASLIVKRCNA